MVSVWTHLNGMNYTKNVKVVTFQPQKVIFHEFQRKNNGWSLCQLSVNLTTNVTCRLKFWVFVSCQLSVNPIHTLYNQSGIVKQVMNQSLHKLSFTWHHLVATVIQNGGRREAEMKRVTFFTTSQCSYTDLILCLLHNRLVESDLRTKTVFVLE